MKHNINKLVEMLGYKRPAWSQGEEAFIKKYLDTIPNMKKDTFGNRYIKIGNSKNAFCCHTDTVHGTRARYKKSKNQPEKDTNYMQQVIVQTKWASKNDGEILGADDTTGVWILLNMISARIPGLYIFHRAEEIGGQGSNWIVTYHPNLVKNINKIVAFDRKGYSDIITYQGTRTASDEFAKSLAKQLGGSFKPCTGGVFTDSANYSQLIPECTNVSMGYFNGHSASEKQDLNFAYTLMNKLLKVNWNSLVIARDPNEEPQYQTIDKWNNWDDGWNTYKYKPSYQPSTDSDFGWNRTYKDTYAFDTPKTTYSSYYCQSCGASWNPIKQPTRCPFCHSTKVSSITTPSTTKPLKRPKKTTPTWNFTFSSSRKKKKKKKSDQYNFDPYKLY